ncbi:alpha/beta fold hydrolase [uncultured Thiodictyon sp.]|uniref:alpha/beta fold hydrolase n=1 Tax=uncultured Thiodictyon sp. TaxID=1846217 RepID=UPI0025FD276D|nr:alpha/beta fold hydrolase [uncultured Thiodictyon sp.]
MTTPNADADAAEPERASRTLTLAAFAVALLALAAIGTGLWHLTGATAGLRVETQRLGEIPVTVYHPAGGTPAPVVIIAHGFAASQQLMQPYAVTLARNGYLAVTFDFPGHGRNAQPFVARLEDEARRVGVLLGALEQVAGFASGLPGGDGRLSLLGHSMAGDVLLRYATAHRDQVVASVLLSPYMGPDAPRTQPRDLLFVFGALEPAMLHEAGRTAITAATGGAVEPGVTYGDLATGSARELVLVPGVEHIGVLYGRGGIGAALDWLNRALGHAGGGFIDARGRSLGLLFLGIVALSWPLSRLLPRAATRPLGAGLNWRRLLPVAIFPALLTPLVLRFMPSDYLSILLGDYLALHFGVYGLLTMAGLWATAGSLAGRGLWLGLVIAILGASTYLTLASERPLLDSQVAAMLNLPIAAPQLNRYATACLLGVYALLAIAALRLPPWRQGAGASPQLAGRVQWPGLAIGTLVACTYVTLAIALPIDRYVTSFVPGADRAWLILGIVPGTWAYFAADGWLTHGPGAPRAAPALTKALFLFSLVAAVALNLSQLFFLIIIVPAILVFFLLYGLIGGWIYRRTRHPLVGALAIGLAFAWAIAVTFPVVD